MTKCWLAVACAEHVRNGVKAGIMQVCHGKAAPLQRIKPGDRVVYYSPTERFQGKDKFQSFTAVGKVKDGEPYAFDMGGGFRPFRRNVSYAKAVETPIRPMLEDLSFSRGNSGWGYQLRFGLFEIAAADMDQIERAMTAAR